MLSQPLTALPTLPTVNKFIRLHFVHLISLVAVAAFLTPHVAQTVRAHRLLHGQLDASGVSLFLMMLSAAIQCGFGAFRGVSRGPSPLFVCLGQYFVILPRGLLAARADVRAAARARAR